MNIHEAKTEILNDISQNRARQSNVLTTEHPELTVGQLCEQIEQQAAPIRRSAHVGNQPPHELLLMTAMPKGIEILLVDTIQGNDNYHIGSPPKLIRLNETEPIPLCTKKAASGRIVGSIAVDESCLPKHRLLDCMPVPGESLADFHGRAIEMLGANNRPTLMSEFFDRHSDLFRATMMISAQSGEVRRVVGVDGKIETRSNICLERDGVFGSHDATPKNQGAMIPLNSMMALDMAISHVYNNSDTTIHLGGRHMVEYTTDPRRMSQVEAIFSKVLAEVGSRVGRHCYRVVNVTGLANIVAPETHISQHQLLASGNQAVDLSPFLEQPCAGAKE